MKQFIKPFSKVSMVDVGKVGGKNASLGEMIDALQRLDVAVPDGFAITVDAYTAFLAGNDLVPALTAELDKLDRISLSNLSNVGEACRSLIGRSALPKEVTDAIRKEYNKLVAH